VEVHEARAVLGVLATDDWATVRVAYRKLIRELHPDRAGAAATDRAAELNEAYAVLARSPQASRRPIGRDATRHPDDRLTHPLRPTSHGARMTARIEEGHRLLIDAPPDEAFTRLLDAAHVVGHVSYVDRSAALFEVIVQHGGEACSLVVSLSGHPVGTEALCTMESIQRVFQPAPEPVVLQLVAAMRTPWVSGPSSS
jgi:hypothetical protein